MPITVNELLNATKEANIQSLMDEIVAKLAQIKQKETELRDDLNKLEKLKKKLYE